MKERGLLEQVVSLKSAETYTGGDKVETITNEKLAFMVSSKLFKVYAQERWWRAMELMTLLYIAKTIGVASALYRLSDPMKCEEGGEMLILNEVFAEDLILTSGGQLSIEVAIVRKTEEHSALSRIVLQTQTDWGINQWPDRGGMVVCRTRLGCRLMSKEYRLDTATGKRKEGNS